MRIISTIVAIVFVLTQCGFGVGQAYAFYKAQNLRQETVESEAGAVGITKELKGPTVQSKAGAIAQKEKTLAMVQQEAQGNSNEFIENERLLEQLFKYFKTYSPEDPLITKGAFNLYDLILAILRQQKMKKVIRKDITKAAELGEWRLEKLNEYVWKLLNTVRSIGIDVPYKGRRACKGTENAEKPPCRLDANKLRQTEGELLYQWRDYFMHANIFPGFEGHLMITYREHEPQFIDAKIMQDMMELAFKKLPDYRIFYNHVSRLENGTIYANCGSSIPDHNHYQGILKHLSDELPEGLPVENAPKELIVSVEGVSISKLVNNPRRGFVIEGNDVTLVASSAWRVINLLDEKIKEDIEGYEPDNKKGYITGVVGYNVIWTRQAEVARIIILPRAADNRPSIAVQDGHERDLYSGNKDKGIIGIKNKLLKELQKENPKADMDVLAGLSKDKVEQLFENINPTEEEKQVFDKFDIGIASIEMSGVIITSNRRDFERLTPEIAQEIYDECSTSEKFLEPIYDKIKKLVSTAGATGTPEEIFEKLKQAAQNSDVDGVYLADDLSIPDSTWLRINKDMDPMAGDGKCLMDELEKFAARSPIGKLEIYDSILLNTPFVIPAAVPTAGDARATGMPAKASAIGAGNRLVEDVLREFKALTPDSGIKTVKFQLLFFSDVDLDQIIHGPFNQSVDTKDADFLDKVEAFLGEVAQYSSDTNYVSVVNMPEGVIRISNYEAAAAAMGFQLPETDANEIINVASWICSRYPQADYISLQGDEGRRGYYLYPFVFDLEVFNKQLPGKLVSFMQNPWTYFSSLRISSKLLKYDHNRDVLRKALVRVSDIYNLLHTNKRPIMGEVIFVHPDIGYDLTFYVSQGAMSDRAPDRSGLYVGIVDISLMLTADRIAEKLKNDGVAPTVIDIVTGEEVQYILPAVATDIAELQKQLSQNIATMQPTATENSGIVFTPGTASLGLNVLVSQMGLPNRVLTVEELGQLTDERLQQIARELKVDRVVLCELVTEVPVVKLSPDTKMVVIKDLNQIKIRIVDVLMRFGITFDNTDPAKVEAARKAYEAAAAIAKSV